MSIIEEKHKVNITGTILAPILNFVDIRQKMEGEIGEATGSVERF